MSDKSLSCKDCGADFIFTEAEQQVFLEKGYRNDPQRCPACRSAKRQIGGTSGFNGNMRNEREMFPAVCAACGKSAMVPFRPSSDKPVYCRECFQPRRR